jgi:tRNA pseudouridine55 synthase
VIVPVPIDRIMEILPRFTGTIQQRPPSFSAMKVGGRRAYQLSRQGQAVTLEPRPVRIDRIELLDYAWPMLRLKVDCGRGTYIRSLARDMGEALGTGGYLTQLRRLRVGPLTSDKGVSLEQLRRDGVQTHLIDPASLFGA